MDNSGLHSFFVSGSIILGVVAAGIILFCLLPPVRKAFADRPWLLIVAIAGMLVTSSVTFVIISVKYQQPDVPLRGATSDY